MFSSFMLNAWIVATMVAVVAGVVGFFVVIRGATFAAHALPLGAFSGAAAAAYFRIDQFAGLIAFSGLGVAGITQLSRNARHEVATALCLVTLLGVGTLFLSMTGEYAAGVYSLLFGEVLGIGGGEIAPVAVASLICLFAIGAVYRPLLLNSVSPDLASVHGVSARWMELVFLAVLALATAMALPVVGVLLVFSLMIAPAAVARSLTDRAPLAILVSVCLALLTVWLSIAIAYVTNWPIGFLVGSFGAVFYGASLVWTRPASVLVVNKKKQENLDNPNP